LLSWQQRMMRLQTIDFQAKRFFFAAAAQPGPGACAARTIDIVTSNWRHCT